MKKKPSEIDISFDEALQRIAMTPVSEITNKKIEVKVNKVDKKDKDKDKNTRIN